MSKPKPLTDLLEEDNASASSPRRSSRIATRRLSSCDEIPTSPPKTRSRRPSLTLENNTAPGKITRSKRSSLSLESDATKDNHSNCSSPLSKRTNSPADITSDGPAKRTRRRGSLTNSTQDEGETVSTPIPNRVSTRRLSGRRSMSKSPTNASPTSENVNLPKAATPKRRGRKPSVTEKVIPLEAIEETELNKVEDENNSSKTKIIDLTDEMTENVDKKVTSDNLETILESSILDNQDGAEIEKNLSKELDNACKSRSSDAGSRKSFKKDQSIVILNDSTLNKSSKDKTLNLSQNAGANNNESINKSGGTALSPAKCFVALNRSKTAEIINSGEDVEENRDNSINKSKKTNQMETSNIEKAEKDLLNVLNSSLQESSKKAESSVNQLCEVDVDLSIVKNETGNKSNESDKENQDKISSVVITENSGMNKESEDLFSEPMEIDDYPPDTSDENMAKCNTPNNSLVLEQSKSDKLNLTQKEEIALSPIISSVGKRSARKTPVNINVLYAAYANSTPKRDILNEKGKEQNNVDSNTPATKSKDVLNTSTQESNVKDKSKGNSKEFINSIDLNEGKRTTRKSLTLNKSEQKSEGSLKLVMDLNESNTKSNLKSRKSSDLNESDSNEKSTRKLRSSTGNTSNDSIDENAKEDLINLEEIVNKSASKEKSKGQSKNLSLVRDKSPSKENLKKRSKDLSQSIDKDKSIEKPISEEDSKRKSKNLSQSIDNDQSIEKSISKEDSKRKSKNLSQSIDNDQSIEKSISKEDSKRKSKNLSQSIDKDKSIEKSISKEDSKRKSKNLSQSIDNDQSIEKSISKEDSKRKSKNLSQSIDKDQSIEKSLADEKTKQKFKDLLQSNHQEENMETSLSDKKQKSLCLSNLIDVDESDDEYNRSTQKSKNITKNDSEINVTSKSINLSKDDFDTSKSDNELEAKINKFVENYNLMDDDDEHHALLDDQASEGEEDTPSENSCDIPVDGESLGSSDSENMMDESYEHDSFIVSDEEPELLSGSEYDIDQPKVTVRRLKVVKDDNDDDNVNTINSSKAEVKKQEPEKDLVLQNTSTKPCSNIDKSSEKKRTSQKNVEEDSDLETMSIKPYCGLDPPSVASSRESLSEADKIEVSSKNTEELVNLSKTSPRKSPNTSFGGSLNISVVEDTENTTRRSRTTSLLVQEQFENYNVENVCDHIAKVVNMVYSNPKKEEVDVCLNVSLEFTEKRKSKTTDTSNTTTDLPLPDENLSSDVISLVSSDDETSKKASGDVINMDSSTDSNMSDDVDEDISTKYYESRLISKEENMRRQSKSGVGKQAKPDPKFSSSSEGSEEEVEQNENLPEELQEQDNKSSKPCVNILSGKKLAMIKQSKKHNTQEGMGKIKILQSTKLNPEIKVQTGTSLQATKSHLREYTEVVPSKKMKINEENLIKKKKQKLQPSKNLTEGDDLEVSYFPSKILNSVTNNKKSNKKPHVVPSKSANQNSWNCKTASPLKPSASISTQKKSKLEVKMNDRDFRSKVLNDKSRNKRMDMEAFLMMKNKLKQKVRP